MYIRPYEEQLMQYDEYKAHKILLLYIPPLLLVLGTIGNILSFCVLMRKAMRRTSTYNYLAVLSLTDMLVLYIGLLRLWVGELTGYDIRDKSDWSCKIITMVGYTVSVYSVWLLIAVTVERYTVVVHSLHAPTMCTRSRAIKTMIGILLVLLCINFHFLFTTQIVFYDNEEGDSLIPQCDAAAGHETLVMEVWPWVDTCLYSLLPFIIIFILNILIIHKVIIARKHRQSMSNSTSSSGGSGSGEGSAKVTVMLLTISFTFLITTLPMNITIITTAFWNPYVTTLATASKFKLARTISEMLMYTNHSINFYLYLLTGQKFRQQLVKIFCSKMAERWNSSVYTQVTHTEATQNGGKEAESELVVLKNGNYDNMDDKQL